MDDHRTSNSLEHRVADTSRATNVAQKMAAVLVRDTPNDLDVTVLSALHNAVLGRDPETAKQVIHDLIANGVTAVDLADFYIPEVARKLGDQWCIDELSFATVTIGSARLQSMLRSLGPDWSGERTGKTATASILLVVPQEVYHTLGALVLGGQLRRKGMSVKLVLGGKPQDVANHVESAHYDCVFLSSSRGETLESLRRLVEAVKTATLTPLPVVIGGTILEVEPIETITALTGADFATSIPEEALRLCGLCDGTQDDSRAKKRA